jgi:hypothetical protein
MTMLVASIRDNDVNVALLVHVFGAMVLVGGLVTAAGAGIIGWRDEAATLRRFSYKVLLAVVLPAYIVMRIGAQWTEAKENLDEGPDQIWIGIGYITANLGALLLLIALIVGGIGLRLSRGGRGGALLKTSTVIATLLLAAYIVAIWAMGAKPT